MNAGIQYQYVQGYIEIHCPDGENYDAFLQGIKGMYTTVSSCYGDKMVRVYFAEWQEVKQPDPERTYICLGTEAPRYCYSGNFVRGFKGTSPADALKNAKASKGGSRYHSVIEYDKNGDYKVIFPKPREFGADGVPF